MNKKVKDLLGSKNHAWHDGACAYLGSQKLDLDDIVRLIEALRDKVDEAEAEAAAEAEKDSVEDLDDALDFIDRDIDIRLQQHEIPPETADFSRMLVNALRSGLTRQRLGAAIRRVYPLAVTLRVFEDDDYGPWMGTATVGAHARISDVTNCRTRESALAALQGDIKRRYCSYS